MTKLILLIFMTNIITLKSSDIEFNIDDILNENFMPTKFLMIDDNSSNIKNISNLQKNILWNASFHNAITTMNFHRKMMNEYLCRNFLAGQILKEIAPSKKNFDSDESMVLSSQEVNSTNTFSKRKGKVEIDSVKDNMLFDPGSSNYQDWLSRTTTLEDIYRHYGLNKNNKFDLDEQNDERQDIEADVTGYAIQQPDNTQESVGFRPNQQMSNLMPNVQNNLQNIANNMIQGNHPGSKVSYTSYGNPATGSSYDANVPQQTTFMNHQSPPEEIFHQPEVVPFIHYHHEGSGKKELILKGLFHIALTALALLSFGIFAVHVILCIAASKQATTTPLPQMVMDPSEPTGGGGDDDIITAFGPAMFQNAMPDQPQVIYTRLKRENDFQKGHKEFSQNGQEINKNEVKFNLNYIANKLAEKALKALEAVFMFKKDKGLCLRKEICSINKYSRSMKDSKKFWIPFFSLGLSWLSGNLVEEKSKWSAEILESLKSAALGLGNAKCESIYKNCHLLQV